MPEFIAPLLPEYAIQVPQSAVSLVGWVVWLGVLIWLTLRKRDRQFKLDRGSLAWLALLSVLILIFTPFLGVPIPSENNLPAPHLMFLAALPWLAAGGILGLVPGVALAGLSGVLLAYLDTHSIFTPFLLMSAALVFTLAIRQKREGTLASLLRIPPLAALAAGAVLFPLTFLALFLNAEGDLATSLVSVLTQFMPHYLALGGMVLLGGTLCLGVQILVGEQWGGARTAEDKGEIHQSLGLRYVLIALPLAVVLLTATVATQWKSAQAFAERSVTQQMTSTAQAVAEALPAVIAEHEAQVQLMMDGLDPAQITLENAQAALDSLGGSGVRFDTLALAGPDGGLLASVGGSGSGEAFPAPEEKAAIQQVLAGADLPPVVIPTQTGSGARLAFFAPKMDPNGQVLAVLWGSVDLAAVPALAPHLSAESGLKAAGGEILIVNPVGEIAYDSAEAGSGTTYTGSSFSASTLYETVDETGLHRMEVYQPTALSGWAVVTAIPSQAVQMQAVQEVIPLILAGLALIVLEAGIAVLMFGKLSKDADHLATQAAKITLGDLSVSKSDHRYTSGLKGLAQNFEQMTASVTTRLQTQSDLLTVSERITGQLKLKDSLQVILVAALEHGISSARIVLLNEAQPSSEVRPDQKFGMGKDARGLAPLDEDVLTVTRVRGQWLMRDAQIGRNFPLEKGMPAPSLLLSLPLRWKNKLLGTLWLASDRRSDLSEEEMAYFKDLAQKAATAIVNHRAFDESLTHQKQLEAVLTALDDALLVTDLNQIVIFANAAVERLPGLASRKVTDTTLAALLDESEFSAALHIPPGESGTREFHTRDEKSYLLMREPLKVDGRMIGMVTLFKDVTAF
jgi:PAS domain-containing protein